MTPQAFEALRTLTRMRDTPSTQAARLVLAEGARPVDAAPVAGISVQACRNAVQRVRKALELARVAADAPPAGKNAK